MWLVWVALTGLGLAACCVGFFVASAIYYVVTAIIYLRMTGTPALATS